MCTRYSYQKLKNNFQNLFSKNFYKKFFPKNFFFIIASSLHNENFGSNAGGVHKGRACYFVTRSTQELQELQEVHSIIVRSALSANFVATQVEFIKGEHATRNKKHTRVTRFTMLQSYHVTNLIKIALVQLVQLLFNLCIMLVF